MRGRKSSEPLVSFCELRCSFPAESQYENICRVDLTNFIQTLSLEHFTLKLEHIKEVNVLGVPFFSTSTNWSLAKPKLNILKYMEQRLDKTSSRDCRTLFHEIWNYRWSTPCRQHLEHATCYLFLQQRTLAYAIRYSAISSIEVTVEIVNISWAAFKCYNLWWKEQSYFLSDYVFQNVEPGSLRWTKSSRTHLYLLATRVITK